MSNSMYHSTAAAHCRNIYSYRQSLHFVLYLKYAGQNVTEGDVREMEVEQERESE